MKIEKYEKIGKSKYRLYLDNGEVIDTYDDVILKNDLLLVKEISPTMYNVILQDSILQEGYNACCKYISVRIRSIKEISDYLLRKSFSSCDIDIIVDRLIKDKFLDDNHFCECFIKDKLRFTTMGEYKIINELKRHNISSDIINNNMFLLSSEVMKEKIEKIVDKKIASNRKLDASHLRNKLYHSLLNLGYSSSLIVEILDSKF